MASLVLFTCKQCGLVKKCAKHSSKLLFCSNKCQHAYARAEYVERWLRGLETGVSEKGKTVSGHVRHWLIETRGKKCEDCGWCAKHPVTGKVPVQIDHVDGDWTNCKPSNLKILCPNCHSLTPTYGALNKGKGRKLRDTLR